MTTISGQKQNSTTQRGFILHAEDNVTVAAVVARFLAAKGYRVESVTNGSEAVESVLSQPGAYYLVITDYAMPVFDGLGCVRLLRQNGYSGKIIVLAASLSVEIEEQFQSLGVDRILHKSSDLGSLDQVICELLDKRI